MLTEKPLNQILAAVGGAIANDVPPLSAIQTESAYEATVGTDSVVGKVGENSVNADIVMVNSVKVPAGIVAEIKVQVAVLGTGVFSVLLMRSNSYGSFTLLDSAEYTAASIGTKVLTAGVDFPADWKVGGNVQIGLECVFGGARVGYANGPYPGYWFYMGAMAGTLDMGFTAEGEIAYTYTVISYQKNEYNKTRLELVESFGAAPRGWVNVGTSWVTDAAARSARSVTAGLANQFRTGSTYGTDARAVEWVFDFGGVNDICGFLFNPVEGGIQAGSLIRLNAGGQKLQIYASYTGANAPAFLAEVATPALAISTKYKMRIERAAKQITATLCTVDGQTLATISREPSIVGYSVNPAYGYDQGTMQGSPGVALISGVSMSVYSYEHTQNTKFAPLLYVLGDSILEPFGVLASEGFGSLLRDAIGSAEVVLSGIGGTTPSTALPRVVSEIKAIKPKNVLIYLGTNGDGSFTESLQKLRYLCDLYGANVYVATVPTQAGYTATVNALPGYVRKVKFDLALTSGGAGSGLLPALYASFDAAGNAYNDSLHPNALGHAAMFARVQLDAPELF